MLDPRNSFDEEKDLLLDHINTQENSSLGHQYSKIYSYNISDQSLSSSNTMPSLFGFIRLSRTLFRLHRGSEAHHPHGIPLARMNAAAAAANSQNQAMNPNSFTTMAVEHPALLGVNDDNSRESDTDDAIDPSQPYGGGMSFSPLSYTFWGTNMDMGRRNERRAVRNHNFLRWLLIVSCVGAVVSVVCILYNTFIKPSTTTPSSVIANPTISNVQNTASGSSR